jgi:hypothetical protein
MLGFGGHFPTKARRYSLRFADLRHARIHYRRSHNTGPETIQAGQGVDVWTIADMCGRCACRRLLLPQTRLGAKASPFPSLAV